MCIEVRSLHLLAGDVYSVECDVGQGENWLVREGQGGLFGVRFGGSG
jgi:hypothetical protein